MDKDNYLKQLKNKIGSLPEKYREEMLKDYKNHFEEGLLLGKSENDIACELGEVDFIAKNIIAEYYIENSHEIDSAKKIVKALFATANVGIGVLNLLMITPLLLSVAVVVICLYLVDFFLLITPVLFILSSVFHLLPITVISVGTNVFWLKAIIAFLCCGVGYILYKALRKFGKKFFSWLYIYIIKSVKFKAFTIK